MELLSNQGASIPYVLFKNTYAESNITKHNREINDKIKFFRAATKEFIQDRIKDLKDGKELESTDIVTAMFNDGRLHQEGHTDE